ncbi:XTP/dITP diphosphatase [Clostridium frigidicarnis]|uniref:dITP/XTP pyrophosphatase n=1 Tax=Clostridium frigidicarnis TaxID=84698 RepID=A0A1I1B946_9CLOT|nr:XTP/dITP diphosphatase [Clostridium frigidicarnis]SFB45208.1 XTP/dITP diphosphohydrolase [Clostridium frigidicarnis]
MKKLIVASNNEHKIKEIKEILKDLSLDIRSLKDENIFIDVEEDGKTFKENALKKAREIYKFLNNRNEKDFIVMSDDSGLVVDILNGEPGVYSARYAGEHGNSKKNNEKLLKKLSEFSIEERKAYFICLVALINQEGKELTIEGKSYGYITENLKGNEGFGYDPIFFVKEFNKTFAEMTPEEKNSISHRGKALEKLKEEISQLI